MPQGRIAIEVERCKGCALCTTVCQPGLVQMDISSLNGLGYHPARLIDPRGQCTGCGLCAVICPDVCISVYRRHPQRAQPEGKRVPA